MPIPRDFQRTLARLSAAGADSLATAAAVRSLASDIRSCTEQVKKLQGSELVQLKAYYHMGQMAQLPLRAVAAAATVLPGVDQDVLHALQAVTGAIVFVDAACSDAGKEPQIPSELVTAWTAAARKVAACVRQLCPRQPNGSRQQASVPPAVQQLLACLLKLWHTVFRCWPGPLDRNPVAASAAEAAELAVMLLTCTPEAEAAQQSAASFELLQRHAAVTLHLLAETMIRKGGEVTVNARTQNPSPQTLAVVSDTVQEGLTLHLAVLLAYKQQEDEAAQGQAAGSASRNVSSLVATAHRSWLLAAGFPSSHTRLYWDNVQGTFAETEDQPGSSSSSSIGSPGARMMRSSAGCSGRSLVKHTPMRLQLAALAGVQHVMLARGAAISQPGWRRRCRGLLAAAENSTTEEIARSVEARRDGRMFAPGVEPVLVLLLLIESACVACWDADGGPAVAAALNVLKVPLQDSTPHNLDPMAVRAVLQHLWLGMGQTLLAAAESQGEQEQQQGEQAAGSSSSTTASSSQQGQQPAGRLYGLVNGGGRVLPTPDAAQQKRFMWSRFATTLFSTFTWMNDVYRTVEPTEMFREQPDLASCVIEAAFRTAREDKIDSFLREMPAHAMVLFGMQLAFANCLPKQLPAATQEALRSKLSSASRHCSFLVSAMKEVEGRAALPGFNPTMLPYLSSITSMAVVGAVDQLEQPTATSTSLPYLAAPTTTAWLFAAGRALVAAGRVLLLVPGWRARPSMSSPPSSKLLLELMGWAKPVVHIQSLLAAMLEQLEQGQPAPPPAAGAPSTAAVENALKSIKMVLQLNQELILQCMSTASQGMLAFGAFSSSPQLLAAFEALTAACASRGLPTSLQVVGASLCAAFPQRFACNNPACASMEGLTEAACAVNKCSGCKVARYCCRAHQVEHWPAHNVVCKHLQKLAAAAAAPAGAGIKATAT